MDSAEKLMREAVNHPLPDTIEVYGQWYDFAPAEAQETPPAAGEWLPGFETLRAGGYDDWELP